MGMRGCGLPGPAPTVARTRKILGMSESLAGVNPGSFLHLLGLHCLGSPWGSFQRLPESCPKPRCWKNWKPWLRLWGSSCASQRANLRAACAGSMGAPSCCSIENCRLPDEFRYCAGVYPAWTCRESISCPPSGPVSSGKQNHVPHDFDFGWFFHDQMKAGREK